MLVKRTSRYAQILKVQSKNTACVLAAVAGRIELLSRKLKRYVLLRDRSPRVRSTLQVKKTTAFFPRPSVDADGGSAVSQAGGVPLTSTVRAAGLDIALR